jgi:ubiquinone/menaquinone biosynthesis C-methylase UbiE
MTARSSGGYDDGYAVCPCFWGREPGTFVARLLAGLPDVAGLRVLDAGCGEGKNAHALATRAAKVTAVDCSALALRNARAIWPEDEIEWVQADVRHLVWPPQTFDLVIAYGLLHCLSTRSEIENVVWRLKEATRIGGRHVICAFNERRQELSAHPRFDPCLLSHGQYLALYRDWKIEEASDEDLYERHPHNKIPHVHSLTRMIVLKPA